MKKKIISKSHNKKYLIIFTCLVASLIIGITAFIILSRDSSILTPSSKSTLSKDDVGPVSTWKSVYFGSDQTIRVPNNWLTLACSNRGGVGISPKGYALGDCAGPNQGKIDILTGPEGVASAHPKSGFEKYYSDTVVEVAGVKGHKYIIVSDSEEDASMDVTIIYYVLTTKKIDHIVSYRFTSKEPDYSDVLDQIISTWVF